MRHSHFSVRIVAAAAGAMLLASCSGGEGDNNSPTFAPTSDPAPSGSASVDTLPNAPDLDSDDVPEGDEAPFPENLTPDSADSSDDASLSPVNMRFGLNDGYDRVVIDLEGTGEPGWLGDYVDEPTIPGSGDPVDIAGEATIHTSVRGLGLAMEDDAPEYEGPVRLLTANAGRVVQEVVYGGVFEGQLELFVGVSSEEPFRVFLLQDPLRVVIDVQHP